MALEDGDILLAANPVAITPDTNHGSTGGWVDPNNAVDGDSGTFAVSSAGGGFDSPTYKPGIRFAVSNISEVSGQLQFVGTRLQYEVIYVPVGGGPVDAQAKVKLILQQYGPSAVADREIEINVHYDTSKDMAKTTRDIYWSYYSINTPSQLSGTQTNEPWPTGVPSVYIPVVTLVNQGPVSSSGSVVGVKVYTVDFIFRDRYEYNSGSQATI